MARHVDMLPTKTLSKQSKAGGRSEPPVIDERRPTGHPAHDRHGGEQHAAGSQDTMRVLDRGAGIVDQLERLGQHKAVECIRGYRVGSAQVRADRRSGIRGVDVHDVTMLDRRAIDIRIGALLDFEHPTANVASMRREKSLDVVAIDGNAAIESPVRAVRRDAPDVAERRRLQHPSKTLQDRRPTPPLGQEVFEGGPRAATFTSVVLALRTSR